MKPNPCKVTKGKLEPCTDLNAALINNSAFVLVEIRDAKTKEVSRSIVGIKGGNFKLHKIILNFCPFCGTRILETSAKDG